MTDMPTETDRQAYTVKAGTFQGPLDLLLSLIVSRKLFINEISLAEVTADYISYVKSLPQLAFAEATNFLVIASTLILIKSRSLLPNLALSGEEEEKIVDLEKRLKLYQMVKEAGAIIEQSFGKKVIFLSPERADETPLFVPDPKMTKTSMYELIQGVLERIPKKEVLQEVTIRKVVNIEEMIEGLTERVQQALSVRFSDFAKNPTPGDAKEEKVYVIVSFLAMLELVREGLIDVMQGTAFEDMEITKQNN